MKKRMFLLIVLISFFIGIWFIFSLLRYGYKSFLSFQFLQTQDSNLSGNSLSSLDTFAKVTVDDVVYSYAFVRLDPNANIQLLDNFKDRKDTKELISIHACKYLINGGFYMKNGEPLGLFYTNGKVFKHLTQNNLIDGSFYKKEGAYFIDLSQEIPNSDWHIQVGPLLILDGEITPLKIKDDTFSRRMIAALDSNKNLYLLSVFGDDSVYQGPLLANLPLVLQEISKNLNVAFIDAVNLDGGSASAFYGDEVILEERNWIGSAFCVKNE